MKTITKCNIRQTRFFSVLKSRHCLICTVASQLPPWYFWQIFLLSFLRNKTHLPFNFNTISLEFNESCSETSLIKSRFPLVVLSSSIVPHRLKTMKFPYNGLASWICLLENELTLTYWYSSLIFTFLYKVRD